MMLTTLRRLFLRHAPIPPEHDQRAERLACMTRELDEALARRKAERLRRAEAARKGVSTKIRRASERARQNFPQHGVMSDG